MISVDTAQLRKLEYDLKNFAARAYPIAVRTTLNDAAFETQARYKNTMGSNMLLRSPWVTKSIRIERAGGYSVMSMQSHVGSIDDSMERQEFGGIDGPDRGHSHPIPTSESAGQADQRPRTRVPTRANRLAQIKLAHKRKAARSPKQRLIIAIQMAVHDGVRKIYMGRQEAVTPGIYRVQGGRKGIKRGWPRGAKLRMLWNLSHNFVQTPRNPMLYPASIDTQRLIPEYYAKALRYQLHYNRIMGY